MEKPSITELSPEDLNIWDNIWKQLHDVRYQSFFEELCAEHSLTLWKRFDAVFKFLQFITAGGSVVAGWSLWNQPGFRYVWAILAGSAVVISAVHGVLGITDKIKQDTLDYSEFKGIRVLSERLKSHMEILAYERLSDYKRDYMDLRSEYDSAISKKKPDFLLTRKAEEKIQAKLNRSLGL